MKRNKNYNPRLKCKMVETCYLAFLILLLFSSCQKIEYTQMENPAYLRVFNSLNLPDVMENAVQDTPAFLCMLINPSFDENGVPVSAEVVGDFLTKREKYAPPYPVHIGVSTTVENPEYPGKETVLVGPVLNGFDLSSWAQILPGKKHFLFMYRPKNSTPFFDLPRNLRNIKAVEAEFDLESGEIYTLQALYANFQKRDRMLALRKENFHKLSLSDSLIYVNFYNYSADGFEQAPDNLKVPNGKPKGTFFEGGVKDTMDIYLTLMKGQDFVPDLVGIILRNAELASKSFQFKFLTTLKRSLYEHRPKPYQSFPMWVKNTENGVSTDLWQHFYFITSGTQVNPEDRPYSDFPKGEFPVDPMGNFAVLNCILNGPAVISMLHKGEKLPHPGLNMPNLVVNTHSGTNNPKSFPTVNSIEIINGHVYLMSLQRKYTPPIY